MKKIGTITLSAILAISMMTACGDSGSGSQAQTGDQSQSAEAS